MTLWNVLIKSQEVISGIMIRRCESDNHNFAYKNGGGHSFRVLLTILRFELHP